MRGASHNPDRDAIEKKNQIQAAPKESNAQQLIHRHRQTLLPLGEEQNVGVESDPKTHSKTYGGGHFDGCLVGFDGSDIEIDAKKWVSYVF